MGNSKQPASVLSFCTGFGGIEQGLKKAGVNFRTIAYVECEAFVIANLVKKIETKQMDAAPIWTDVRTFPVGPFRNNVQIMVGGYPCQPFSFAGPRRGTDDARHLWPYIAKTIEAIRPVRCFFENVEGHITSGLRNVIADLAAMDYRTAWGIFSAAEVGAPHQRKRVFIMADANSAPCKRRGISSRVYKAYPDANGTSELADWPAMSGQKQHDWEKPRVIKPGMGGATDGSSCRLDRLRLLGNGVVPATAAIAWTTLSKRLLVHNLEG